MKWSSILAVVITLSLGYCLAEEKTQPLKQAMQKKLTHAQGVLAGITQQDFQQISKHADQLVAITKTPRWKKFNTEKYRLYSSEFGRIADMISQSAKRKNLDESALHYLALTRTCIHCHKHVRDMRDN